MWKLYTLLSTLLGSQRQLIRRIAALCLILMGVHAAADHLDDALYKVIDVLDLWLDDAAAALLAWVADQGGLAPVDAAQHAEDFARSVDLAQKDRLAIVLALAAEFLLDVLLFDFAWGRRDGLASLGLWAELKDSGRQMVDALRPLDMERLAVMPTVLAFSFLGSVSGALSAELLLRTALQRVAPEFLWGSSVAAGARVLSLALLMWRFAPDLLHGALMRSRERGDRARDRALRRLEQATARFPRLRRALALLRLLLRGAWLVVLALPIAVTGILSSDVFALVTRAIPSPGDTW